jgi:hypothetical protein
MPTTTNFGWTTPADTDLVKDGAAAIRTFAGNVDTSLVDLKGGTTGQYLQKNSGTDLDYVWADVSAGGITLISTTTLTGASVTLSAIPGTYRHLQLVVQNYRPASDNGLKLRMNSDSAANRHMDVGNQNNVAFDSTSFYFGPNTDAGAASQSLHIGNILDYTNTVTWKIVHATSIVNSSATNTNVSGQFTIHAYNQTAAITSLQMFPDGGNFTSGTALLYGVK